MERRIKNLEYSHLKGVSKIQFFDNVDDLYSSLPSQCFIISDQFFEGRWPAHYFLEALEKNKTLEVTQDIIGKMLEVGVSRETHLVSIGGGLVSDIAGLIAATYMRGVPWINIPTTLLSQVDSSIGGKVGVNFRGVKNIMGSFYQPKSILISLDFLKTLPSTDRETAMGEVFKYAMLDSDFKRKLIEKKFQMDESLIKECLKIKIRYIEEDEFDCKGARSLLNIGHTLAHAIESCSHFQVSHGEAVWWGLMFEASMNSHKLDSFLLEFKPFFTHLVVKLDAAELISVMKHDKKGSLLFFDARGNKVPLSETEFTAHWLWFTAALI